MKIEPKIYVPKLQNTCKGCEERHVGCHATCDKYIEATERRNEEYQKMREALGQGKQAQDFLAKGAMKRKKRAKR